MKRIISIVLLALVSSYALAQEPQDSLQQQSVQEKFPRTTLLNFEYGQSLDRGLRSELFGEQFQEGHVC